MKVLHVSTPMSWRGGEQQAAYLALALKEMKVEVSMLTPFNSALSARMLEDGISVINFKSRGVLDLNLAKKIAKVCKEQKIDVIHTHDSHAHSAAILSAAVFNNNTPIVVSRRVDFAVSSNLFSKWKYNHASIKKIVCVSDKIKEITAPSIKDKSKLVTVHSGIDLKKFENIKHKTTILREEFGLEKNTILIGNVAALAPHKDYITFLETAKLLLPKLKEREKQENTHREIRFFLIGKEDGSENEIKDWLNQNQKTKEYFILTGFRNDIPQILPELDIFLFTSQTEGLGTSVLDAFASNVPVVATAAGGIPESVVDNKTGLLSKIKDAVSLAENVEKIVYDEELREKLIHNATIHLQNFTKENTAKKTLEIYNSIQ